MATKAQKHMEKEEWKHIENYEGLYEVSNFGRVKSIPRLGTRGGIMKFGLSRGYYSVCLTRNDFKKSKKIHLLVWDAFGDKPRNGFELQVDHIKGKLNNQIDNLQLLTNRENNLKYAKTLKNITSSKFIGVSRYKSKWRSYITLQGKWHFIGYFETEEEAYQAYRQKKREAA